ncbi:glycosyltransferase family 2 protein [Rubrivivax gelatinosus]|uniref:Glycosyl transferase family 2 n=1 Tax=Rubrivivax gelatinosus TaxID=28068 RepID=A0A4R2MD26_RUBGE|nr:glycosyltransferase family 2 protein [Rubrivivax gelatinosus]MBK1688164.1 hypothetical protein [Rubrivivax gelatinosus]TCP02527.1 glycosyl transferase family 2 [Rubrivivax gelatinosus]
MNRLPMPLDPAATLPWEADLHVEPATADLPTLSVVMPVYNAGKYLEKTLRSLLCNDLAGVEIIMMDGGSKDETPAILAHYRDMFAHVQSERDKGQSDAINKGMARATGRILCWLNGDDLFLPNVLNAVRARFRDTPGCEVVVGDAYMTELDLRPIRHFVYGPERLTQAVLLDYARNHLVQPSVFFSRRAWDAAGPVKLDLHYSMDADLFLRMAGQFTLHHLPLDIAYSVYHEDCKTRSARAESISELALVQAGHGGQAEATATMQLLLDLHHQLERRIGDLEEAPASGPSLREQALLARVAELERRLAVLADAFVEIDALESA